MEGLWLVPSIKSRTRVPKFLSIKEDREHYYLCDGGKGILKRGIGSKFFELESEALAYMDERYAPILAKAQAQKLRNAAPELLEALSQCVEQMRAYNLTPHPKASSGGAWRYISAQETAKKAIAKAT